MPATITVPASNAGRPSLVRVSAVCALAVVLTACAQPTKPMYNWQTYQPSVYAYLNDDGADYAAQTALLEQNIETARSAVQALPPGFHAHLGLLYLKLGNDDKAVEQLMSEKLSFPEASPFVDFLLRGLDQPDAEAQEHSASAASPQQPNEQQAKGGV